jgi:toxin ParE1/3/4
MPKATYGSKSNRDLRQIADYIARANPSAALAWFDEIRAVCDLLAAHPEIGQRVRTRRSGKLRRHVAGTYAIYYQPVPEGIAVVRILHGARDQPRLLDCAKNGASGGSGGAEDLTNVQDGTKTVLTR